MARSHVISAMFLTLVSANMIQGRIISQLFQNEEAFPNLINVVGMPKLGELSHRVASSAAGAASNAFNGFKTYVDDFRTGLGQYIDIPPTYDALNHFVNGEIWPSFGGPAVGVDPSSQGVAPGILGNYGSVDSSAASAANSGASGGLAKRLIL